MAKRQKVFVGLSGGVDSAVSAFLLKKQGFDVIGVFIKVWSPDWLPCTWPEERRDAMRVCAHLNIPFITLDLSNEYKKEVADYMLREYKAGRTPNPDVMCNKEIKFGAFYDWAMHPPAGGGADFVATGHYARIELRRENYELMMGSDTNKDQSYFLWNIKNAQLKHILFPIGDLKKERVREIAKRLRLPVAEKKDSQGICFLGKLDMKEFLKHYIKIKNGNVLDKSGNIIGKHDGAIFYTIGEHISIQDRISQSKSEGRLFVVSKDTKKNTLTVSSQKIEDANIKKEFTLTKVNWISDTPNISKTYYARVRYRQELQEVRIMNYESRIKKATIKFDKPQSVDAGQSVVIYLPAGRQVMGNVCLGGGIVN